MSLLPLPTGIPVSECLHIVLNSLHESTVQRTEKQRERNRVRGERQKDRITNLPFFKKKPPAISVPLKPQKKTAEKKERWTGGYREEKKNQAATSYISFLASVFWHKGVFEEAETGRIVSQRLASSTGEQARETSSPRLSTTQCAKERGGSLFLWLVLGIRKIPPTKRVRRKQQKGREIIYEGRAHGNH